MMRPSVGRLGDRPLLHGLLRAGVERLSSAWPGHAPRALSETAHRREPGMRVRLGANVNNETSRYDPCARLHCHVAAGRNNLLEFLGACTLPDSGIPLLPELPARLVGFLRSSERFRSSFYGNRNAKRIEKTEFAPSPKTSLD